MPHKLNWNETKFEIAVKDNIKCHIHIHIHCLHNICVYCVYLLCTYKHTHMPVYIFKKKSYVFILNIFIW